MRQMTLHVLAALIALQCVSCDSRVPKAIGSKASPDGQHMIWITEESGGLRSGVTSVHLTRSGAKPEAKNEILSSPECNGVKVAWNGDGNIIISYDEIYGSFHSKLISSTTKISLIRNTDLKKFAFDMKDYLAIPCDPL